MSSFIIPMLFANAFQKNKKKKKLYETPKAKIVVQNVCRICNLEKGDIPIFNNFMQPNISEEIHNFSGVDIKLSDNASKFMCQSCLDLLNGCIMFREMCRKNNKDMIAVPIKKECKTDIENDVNDIPNEDSDKSLRVPTPTVSEDNTEVWGCFICSEEFIDMNLYNIHLSTCKSQPSPPPKQTDDAKRKRFLCDVCGKVTCSNANLLVHKATHENIFPYECDTCPYKGRTIDLLKVHQRVHLADKPYKCTQCPKATTTASNLAKHMSHVHSKARPYKCNYCDRAFTYQYAMRRHVKDIHLRQGTAECDVCLKKFNTKKILQGHKLKVHKMKSERQGRLPSYLQCKTDEKV